MTGVNYLQEIRNVLEPLLSESTRVALFDFPTYDNVGDHAIWLGETFLLRQALRKKIISSGHCGMETLPDLAADVPILLQGGGNLGDLWPHHESFRLRVIQRYPGNRIVILPQSIHFSSREVLKSSARISSRHPDLHICVRDAASLEDAACLSSPERVWLCPDMALAIGALERPQPATRSVYVLRRADREAADFGILPSALQSGDWVGVPRSALAKRVALFDYWQMRYPNRTRSIAPLRLRLYEMLAREHLDRGLRLLAASQVVITDRLHAHLLCSMMGMPHVVLDNSYGKISRFRKQWNTGGDICRTARSWEESVEHSVALLQAVNVK